MSSYERKARRRRNEEARRVAIRAARAQGCTCDVEIDVGAPDHPAAGLSDVGVAVSCRHDDWCPLVRCMEERPPGLARTQAVFYWPEHPTP